ncbi:MAG: alpha/beta hydrolase [Chloroflexi bacterium]|nr:alpha/beta hydrolase [Chloroflexota bacterium]
MIPNEYEHHFIQTNGITLHVVMAGTEEGRPLILLHGFPEFWFGWRHQISFLTQQGYRVIVPDQRGYNLSDKPRDPSAYHLDTLAQDVTGLMDALGYAAVYLAGHDWGGVVAWWLAAHYAERLHKVAILNAPYPTAMGLAARQLNWKQFRKSWYILAFQLPGAERAFHKQNEGDGRNILLRISKPDTFSPEELIVYEHAWQRPTAVTGMLNWYRASMRDFFILPHPTPASIQTEILLLWGAQDRALGRELAEMSVELCANGRLIFFPHATHWLQHDEVEAVNIHLTDFF